jgi:hypothetical protein
METVGDTAINKIEHNWKHAKHQIAPEMSAWEIEFFKELKASGGLDAEERVFLEDFKERSKKGFIG